MTEVVISGCRPVVDRRVLEESVAAEEEWVVITDRAGHRPAGAVPTGGIVVSVLPVTEAIKLAEGGRVVVSIDRADLAEIVLPVLLARSTLAEVLASGTGDPVDVVTGVADTGGAVVAAS